LQTGRSPLRAWVAAIGQGPRGALLVYATLLDLGLVAAILTSDRAWQLVLVALPVVVGVRLLRWQTQARLRAETALRLAHLGTWTWDLATGGRTWSADARRILGAETAPATGDPLSGLVHADDRERLDAALAEWAAGRARRGASVDVRVVLPDGAERVIAVQGEIERDAGRPVRVVGTILDITERTWREADLVRRASLDPLTGLPNRAFLLERLAEALGRQGADLPGIAVLFLDLDGFKAVNDTFGHAAGDEVLAEVARTIQAGLRPGDTGARFGGDEFVVLLDPVLDPQEALAHAGILVRRLRRSYVIGERTDAAVIAASIGVAWAEPGGTTAEALLHEADLALRHAKATGKDRAILDPDGEPARRLRTAAKPPSGGEVVPGLAR
jgi:diguanylate cyclase (GGDEF)-like protein/PAS domain S-box-containing protein